MACIVSLYDALGAPKDTGGRWFLESAGPINLDAGTCPGPLTPIVGAVAGDLISADHDACVDLGNIAAGDYVFRYVVPVGAGYEDCETGCNDCAIVTITVQEGPEDGAPVEYCENVMTCVNLFDLLGNVPSGNGNWGVSPAATFDEGTADDGTDDCFIPHTLGAGVFTFTYTVNSDGTCDNCVATVEVTITAADSSGESAEVFICN